MSYKLRVCGIDVFSFDFKTLNLRQFFNLLSIRLSSFRLFNHKRHIRKTKETKVYRRCADFFCHEWHKLSRIFKKSIISSSFPFDFKTFDIRQILIYYLFVYHLFVYFLPQKAYKKNKRNKVYRRCADFFLTAKNAKVFYHKRIKEEQK